MRMLIIFTCAMLAQCVAADLKEEFAKLKNEFAIVKNVIPKLQTRIKQLEVTEIPHLNRRLQQCESSLNNLTYSVRKENQHRRLILPQTPADFTHVAFYAHLSKNVDGIGLHHPLIFDTLRYNDGGAYSNLDGEFTTKVPGTYMFMWTISARDRTYMETELVVNGVVFGHVIGDAAEHDDWAVATGFAIVKLNVDDTVWIRSGPINNGHLTGVGFGTSFFAGFLMYQ